MTQQATEARWECWTCKDRSLSIAAQSSIKAWDYEFRRGPKAAASCRAKGHDVRPVAQPSIPKP